MKLMKFYPKLIHWKPIENPKKNNAKYFRHVPYLKVASLRVELSNKESDFENERYANIQFDGDASLRDFKADLYEYKDIVINDVQAPSAAVHIIQAPHGPHVIKHSP